MSVKEFLINKRLLILAFLVLFAAIGVKITLEKQGYYNSFPQISQAEPQSTQPELIELSEPLKILHVMSYHSPWKWTEDQFNGFKDALRDLPVDYKVVEMDTKRNSDEQWKQKITAQAIDLIDTWKPDLVFTGDDNAQVYVTSNYINSSIPFVFCAVNADPKEYGFDKASNVTGILERMHFVQTINLLKELVPSVGKIAMITDTGHMWGPMIDRFKTKENQLNGVKIVSYDVIDTFDQYKQTVLDYQNKVDALGFMGVFEFKDQNGHNVPLEEVISWTVENSQLPDFAFWRDRVDKGNLCAVTVSGFAQGKAAGEIARGILVRGRKPSDYPIKTTEKGLPVINLARARKLNINPKASVILTAEVVR